MSKQISVLMTVFNAERYLKESIESILHQTFKDFELIIIDDFSSDNSKNIIEKFEDKRLKFFPLDKKLGRTKSLNFGLEKCKFDLIAIQDADDISHPDRLIKCQKKFTENNLIGLIGTNFSFVDSNSKAQIKIKNFFDKKLDNLKFINSIPHSSIIFDRSKFYKKTTYDESFIYAQDYHLILEYFKHSKILLLDEKLVKIRIHPENMTNNSKYKKVKLEENIRLLNYSSKNFKLSIFEKKKILSNKLKNYFKLLFKFY
jgi:glycosyltransferase involved in cell wall biosynthesis